MQCLKTKLPTIYIQTALTLYNCNMVNPKTCSQSTWSYITVQRTRPKDKTTEEKRT